MILDAPTYLFLRRLQTARARYCLRCPAVRLEWAAEEAVALGAAFEAALMDGTLAVMGENAIQREIDAGTPDSITGG